MRRLLGGMLLIALGSSAWGEMYTWKDRQGTAHFTNSVHEIPARYLRKARVLDVATGKVGGLVTQQPAVPGAPGQPPLLQVSGNAGAAPVAPAPLPMAPAPTAPQLTPPAPAALTAPRQQPRESVVYRRRHLRASEEQE